VFFKSLVNLLSGFPFGGDCHPSFEAFVNQLLCLYKWITLDEPFSQLIEDFFFDNQLFGCELGPAESFPESPVYLAFSSLLNGQLSAQSLLHSLVDLVLHDFDFIYRPH
jgi:hypothetical protein